MRNARRREVSVHSHERLTKHLYVPILFMMVSTQHIQPLNRIPGAMSAKVALLTERRLEELDRLRGMGMEMASKLSTAADALPLAQHYSRLTGRYGYISQLDRIIRAV